MLGYACRKTREALLTLLSVPRSQFLYGHGAISKAGYADIVSACGDPAKGPNAWGGSPDPPDGTAAYRSEECEAARQKANGNVGSFEVRARASGSFGGLDASYPEGPSLRVEACAC